MTLTLGPRASRPLLRILALGFLVGPLSTFSLAQSPLTIPESTYRFDGYKVWWTIVLVNPNTTFYARRPRVIITARDDRGAVLGSKDKTFPSIPPGGRLPYDDDLETGSQPSKLEFTVMDSEFKATPSRPSDYKPFQFQQVTIRCSSAAFCRITGDVFNPYKKAANLMATLLFRDQTGKLLGGNTFFIKEVPASASLPFDSSLWAGSVPTNFVSTELVAFCGWTMDCDSLLN